MKLLQTQKNEVMLLIREHLLNPKDFFWSKRDFALDFDGPFYAEIKLVYKPNKNFYYKFNVLDKSSRTWITAYSPGEDELIQKRSSVTWSEHQYSIPRWLSFLKREIEAPDLWKEVEKYKPTFSIQSIKNLENVQINSDEFKIISNSLKSLEKKIESKFNELKSGDINFIKSELQYLCEAGERYRRKDWVLLAIGTVIYIAWDLGMNPDQANKLWELFEELLKVFFNFLK